MGRSSARMFNILAAVNEVRRHAGFETLGYDVLRYCRDVRPVFATIETEAPTAPTHCGRDSDTAESGLSLGPWRMFGTL